MAGVVQDAADDGGGDFQASGQVALVDAALFHELLDSVGDAFLGGVAGEFELGAGSGGFLSVVVSNCFGQTLI